MKLNRIVAALVLVAAVGVAEDLKPTAYLGNNFTFHTFWSFIPPGSPQSAVWVWVTFPKVSEADEYQVTVGYEVDGLYQRRNETMPALGCYGNGAWCNMVIILVTGEDTLKEVKLLFVNHKVIKVLATRRIDWEGE